MKYVKVIKTYIEACPWLSGRAFASQPKGPGFESGSGHCAGWIWVYYSCGSAASFGWDVKPRSSLCSTPNMDYKDPDITEEENL